MLKMKALVKVGFVAVVLAVLSGCASSNALTKAEDGVVNKPVSLNGMTQEFREWNVDGSLFKVQVFVDQNGKYYDEDGITATKEGYRILSDGKICTPTHNSWLDHRIRKFDNGNLDLIDCSLDEQLRGADQNGRIAGAIIGGGLGAGLVGVLGGREFKY
jgi:hypothetical protein